jgi:hypothetical protein
MAGRSTAIGGFFASHVADEVAQGQVHVLEVIAPHGPSDADTLGRGSPGIPVGITCKEVAPPTDWHCAV